MARAGESALGVVRPGRLLHLVPLDRLRVGGRRFGLVPVLLRVRVDDPACLVGVVRDPQEVDILGGDGGFRE